ALAHCEGWNGACVCALLPPTNPFLGPEEEELVALFVEFSWNQYRATEIKPELIETERRRAAVDRPISARVANPGIGIKLRVSKEFKCVAVESLAAALGDHSDLSAGRAAVFRQVVGR